MVDKKLFTPIYIAETPFVNGQLKPKKAKKSIFELQNSAALNDNIYHFTYRKGEKLIHCFYVVENWDEPERFLFIENNELYDEFTSQFGSEGEAEVGRMDTYLDIDSLESVVEKLTDTIENGYYLEDRVCHLYGQGMWNDKAFIVANRVALEELRDAINMALSNGEFRLSSSTSDNEPYDLFISCVPSVFDWDTIELPYHDETYFNKTKSPVKAFDKYRYKLK
ncbi:hypothetical protein AB1L16_27020 [Peribacillus frigoritolerans]|uniref:hypothetical protein n=1 Tax=Peribacillus frigoritolerans TaxID=450367 RepID=UPI00399FA062